MLHFTEGMLIPRNTWHFTAPYRKARYEAPWGISNYHEEIERILARRIALSNDTSSMYAELCPNYGELFKMEL